MGLSIKRKAGQAVLIGHDLRFEVLQINKEKNTVEVLIEERGVKDAKRLELRVGDSKSFVGQSVVFHILYISNPDDLNLNLRIDAPLSKKILREELERPDQKKARVAAFNL